MKLLFQFENIYIWAVKCESGTTNGYKSFSYLSFADDVALLSEMIKVLLLAHEIMEEEEALPITFKTLDVMKEEAVDAL